MAAPLSQAVDYLLAAARGQVRDDRDGKTTIRHPDPARMATGTGERRSFQSGAVNGRAGLRLEENALSSSRSPETEK